MVDFTAQPSYSSPRPGVLRCPRVHTHDHANTKYAMARSGLRSGRRTRQWVT